MRHSVFHTDLIFLHPPSVYDFRKTTILEGPVSDVVPSTDQFEMYPVGLTSIAAYLEKNHYNVRIVNLAYRMLQDRSLDVERFLGHLSATVFGIDLHWLPHAQGALAIAEMVKRLHPESFVLFGGLSSTYYHEELIRYPFVDFVLRGDSTEEPCRQLLAALRNGTPLETVDNLTWKHPDGHVVVNPLRFVPDNLDYVDVPDYRYMAQSVFKYGSMRNLVPYVEWLHYPQAMILNARGCTQNCAICGGSRDAYRQICNRTRPAFRSPEKLAQDVAAITSFSRAPIFMVHDPRIGGMQRAKRLFELLASQHLLNPFVFELFFPADDRFFEMVQKSVPNWSLEITIESPNVYLRAENGKFICSNEKLEETLEAALHHGCQKLDLFFMVGIPHQRYEDALATVDYCQHLVERFHADRRLQFYVSPLGPFLDPGSRAFEEPKFGYRHIYTTLEEHRQALLKPTWAHILSYETDAMNREEIVAASYDVAERLNELKYRYGLIDSATHDTVRMHLQVAREVLHDADEALQLPQEAREKKFEQIRAKVAIANESTLCGNDELKWAVKGRFRISRALASGLLRAFSHEMVHSVYRLCGKYDTAIYHPEGSLVPWPTPADDQAGSVPTKDVSSHPSH